jgi:nitroreductase
MESMIETIYRRVSVRSYTEEPIGQESRQTILDLLQTPDKGPFEHNVRFALTDSPEIKGDAVKGLGTYGFISGAKSYIVSAIKDYRGETGGEKAFVDVGYCFEKIILAATNLGLGTCWMGGTFKRGNFARSINASEDEIVPAVSPIGYPRASRTLREIAVRRFANSDSRKPWKDLFFVENLNTPLPGKLASDYAVPLECVRLGPSASNMQPWRIVYQKQPGAFHFYLKRSRGYNKLYRTVDFQLIDMGISMCHFELAAAEKGLAGRWEMIEPDLSVGKAEYIATWKEL